MLTTHGVITAESGLRMVLSGQEEQTILHLTVSALAVSAGADAQLGNALGVTADPGLGVAAGYYSFQQKPVTVGPVETASVGARSAGLRVNTGVKGVGRTNCGFCVAAQNNAVPSTSTGAADAGR